MARFCDEAQLAKRSLVVQIEVLKCPLAFWNGYDIVKIRREGGASFFTGKRWSLHFFLPRFPQKKIDKKRIMVSKKNRQPLKRNKPRRSEIAADENLCNHCGAKCCRYFALPLEAPTDWEDFEYIRWYLLHQGATVFIEDNEWYLLVHSRCKALRDDNLCGAYETRPQICRDYHTDNCEYEDDWVYEHYFENDRQVAEYAEAILGPRQSGGSHRSPRPLVGALK